MKFIISTLLVLLISIMSHAQETKTTTADTLNKTGILVEETKNLEEIKIAQQKAMKDKVAADEAEAKALREREKAVKDAERAQRDADKAKDRADKEAKQLASKHALQMGKSIHVNHACRHF